MPIWSLSLGPCVIALCSFTVHQAWSISRFNSLSTDSEPRCYSVFFIFPFLDYNCSIVARTPARRFFCTRIPYTMGAFHLDNDMLAALDTCGACGSPSRRESDIVESMPVQVPCPMLEWIDYCETSLREVSRHPFLSIRYITFDSVETPLWVPDHPPKLRQRAIVERSCFQSHGWNVDLPPSVSYFSPFASLSQPP